MIYKMYPTNIIKLALSVFLLFHSSSVSLADLPNKNTVSVNVGLIFGDIKHSSDKTWLRCIQMALSEFYVSHSQYKTRLVLKVRESGNNAVTAAANALDLIKNEKVQAIIGPVTRMETRFVINLGEEARVPIISYSATSPSLTSLRSPYFFQFAQNDSSQVKAISSFVKAFGWRQVVLVYVNNWYSEAVIPYLTEALEEINARVPYRSVISVKATDDQIEKELYKLMTMQTRVFILHMPHELLSRLLQKANEIGMMNEGYVWILTNGMTNGMTNGLKTFLSIMDGVLGVETYVQMTTQLKEFMSRWSKQFQEDTPVSTISNSNFDIFGLWAYDAAFALAMAIEQVYVNTSIVVHQNLTNLESGPVSQHGPKLCKALLTTRFEGIAGYFSLVDGQRQSSAFQIVNINGGRAQKVGFWTPEHGLVVKGNSSSSNIGPIIWPGDSLSVPKGWEMPTNGRRLKIGVPVKDKFTELIKVTKDPSTNTNVVTGFIIDVFKAAIEMLPYALPYDFVPFTIIDGSHTGHTYNDLCYQVYLGKIDAVVGDVTIRVNRSLYVDFTMPYTQAGVMMVAPVKDIKRQSAWAFLKPWRWDLWLATACFFLLIGFVVWVLEHRINKYFRGPPAHQVGASLWFSFSTMVFAQPARVVSNLARVVMTVWIFVLLVLTINYTASLTSFYTVNNFQPAFTNLDELLRNGENVGYRQPYHLDILNQAGFDYSRIKAYSTMVEIDEALAKGGIAAFVDESPYMQLFIAKYCKKYKMLGPVFKTNGYAFVFPKHSPLTHDVSQAILNVTEGEIIMNIENKWFKKESNCEDLDTKVSSNSRLGTDSFWALFFFVGLASTMSLVIFLSSFICRHRHVLMRTGTAAGSEHSAWQKIKALFYIFIEKDFNCHTFKTKQQLLPPGVVEANRSCPRSPVRQHNTDHTDSEAVFDNE